MKFFKEHFGIPKGQVVAFLDIPIDSDIEYFIDPFLIANNRSLAMNDHLYVKLKSFFVKLNRDFIVPNNVVPGLEFLDNLHEPNEYHLGYSGSNKGAAISDMRAQTIFSALRNNRFARVGFSVTNEAHNVLLLVTGIGQDIMSDTIANVCRDIYAEFTLQQCRLYNIPTQLYERDYYNSATESWERKIFELPEYQGKCIILLPLNGLSSSRSYVNHYNYFVAGNYIAKDVLAGKMLVAADGTYVRTLKDGTRRVIVKRIAESCYKCKDDLIDYVLEYGGSLESFLDYAKEHYPSIDLSDLN
jgi:hypothetical protein